MLLNKKQLNQFYSLSFLLVLAGLLAYIIYKAFNCAITNDEAYSFRLVHTGSLRTMMGTANTHWVNSLFMYLLSNLAGFNDPGVLRISSIAGFLIYGYAVYRFARTFRHSAVSFATVVILLLNPFVLDYFSLARGYGLAVGLETLGLFYFLKAYKTNDRKPILKALVILAFAVAANYCTFYIFFCASLFYFFLLFRNKEAASLLTEKKSLRLCMLIIGLVSACAIVNLLLIKTAGDLQYGGDHSFFETIRSLIVFSTYGWIPSATAMDLAKLLTAVIMSMAVYQLYKNFFRRTYSPAYGLGFIIVATFIIFHILHLIAGTPFLYGRTAIVLFPVYILFLLFVADSFNASRAKNIMAFISYAGGLLAILNFFNSANPNYFYEWRASADATVQLQQINQLTQKRKQPGKPVVFLHGIYGIFINYYSLLKPDGYYFDPLKRIDWSPLNPDKIFAKSDYAILPVYFWEMHAHPQKSRYRVLITYPVSKTVLVERIYQ
jgi:hypothetical protein